MAGAIALAAFAAWEAWSLRRVFLVNKGRYLVHQEKWDEAARLLDRAPATGDNATARALLLAKVALNRGDPGEAIRLLEPEPDSAQRHFLAGLSFYMTGREREAAGRFRESALAPDGLSPWTRTVAAAAAETLDGRAGVAPPAVLDPLATPVERMFAAAIRGRAWYNAGRLEDAAEPLESAVTFGDRNASTRAACAATLAALGESARAQRIADMEEGGTPIYPLVVREAVRLADSMATHTLSEQSASWAVDRHRRLHLAELWALARAGRDALPSTAPLAAARLRARQILADYPRSLGAALFEGEILESMGDLREAFAFYEGTLAWQPCYTTLLRMRDLAGGAPGIAAQAAAFLSPPRVLVVVNAEEAATTSTTLRGGGLCFYRNASATLEFEIPAEGEYEVTLVARGDRAFGLSPLVIAQLDGAKAAEFYIARDGWDCYPLRRTMKPGRHALQLDYVNNSERLRSDQEDRNFYLEAVIISRPGAP
jgi:tetratricopeptide (TPR) repeat protein